MSDGKINVSGLVALLHSVLDETELTCKIIETNCSDVNKLLKRWELPDEACSEDDKSIECSCKTQEHDEQLEMACDIEQLLQKAKTTREKMLEKQQQNKSFKFSFSNGIKSKTPSNLQAKKGTSIFQSRHVSSASTSTKYSRPLINCSEDRERPKSAQSLVTLKSSSNLKNKNSKIKKSLIPFQTTYQRDFAGLVNRKLKRQIHPLPSLEKNCSNKCAATRVGCMSNQGGNGLEKSAIANLVDSLKRTSISNKDNRTSTAHAQPSKLCPVHNAVAVKRPHKKIVLLQEAIDILGVPSEVLKPLKTYYQYLSQNNDNVCLGSNKSQVARNKFLERLTNMNECSWDGVGDEPVVDLWKGYTSLLQDTYSAINLDGSGDHSTLRDLMSKVDLLESAFQRIAEFDISPHNGQLSSDETKDSVSDSVDDDSAEWALAGVWNKKCQIIFSGMKQIMNMRYQDEKHCQLFQQNLQKIQALQLQMAILETMKSEIFPQINQLDRDSPVFMKFYKMCFALSDISCLTLPILIKI